MAYVIRCLSTVYVCVIVYVYKYRRPFLYVSLLLRTSESTTGGGSLLTYLKLNVIPCKCIFSLPLNIFSALSPYPPFCKYSKRNSAILTICRSASYVLDYSKRKIESKRIVMHQFLHTIRFSYTFSYTKFDFN